MERERDIKTQQGNKYMRVLVGNKRKKKKQKNLC